MKQINVVFKDEKGLIYIGDKDDTGNIIGFKSIQIQMDILEVSTYNTLKLNEFLIVEIEDAGNKVKETPISKGELNTTVADSNAKAPSPICEMPKEERLAMFNGVVNQRPNGS